MFNKQVMYRMDDTQFLFATQFAGDPKKDKFGDSRRKANIIIKDPEQAKDLMKAGFKIRNYIPKNADEDWDPIYFVTAIAQYRKRSGEPVKYPPNVYLVDENNRRTKLTEDTIAILDEIRVAKVDVIMNDYVYDEETGGKSMHIRTMYVYQDMDDDPYASRFTSNEDHCDACAIPGVETDEVFY